MRGFIANLYPPPERLLDAHLAMFDRLFAQPARAAGAERWGLKETRLSADHAAYLKWLFPRAKFLFLVRNPYDAYRSYAARRDAGWKWFNRWPDQPLTVQNFARHWRELTASFLAGAEALQALLVRYEDLRTGDYAAIEAYLGWPLAPEAAKFKPADGPPPVAAIPEIELTELDREVGPVARDLGYPSPDIAAAPLPAVDRVSTPSDRSRCGGEKIGTGTFATSDSSRFSRLLLGASPISSQPRCVILVPAAEGIEPACEEALRHLERCGYPVRRLPRCGTIDRARNRLATDALADGFEETMWIGPDIVFDPGVVDRLRAHGLPLVCGIYPQPGRRELCCQVLPGTPTVVFGDGGGLLEIQYAGGGFLLVRCAVYLAMQTQLQLPLCHESAQRPQVPFFQPLVSVEGGVSRYLPDDYAFCERARRCGYRVHADTTLRLSRLASYPYSWEEAGTTPQRYARFDLHLQDG
jgi:hypothetical protein